VIAEGLKPHILTRFNAALKRRSSTKIDATTGRRRLFTKILFAAAVQCHLHIYDFFAAAPEAAPVH
jgi:hypothetical protein